MNVIDWPELETALQHFAQATGVCVSAFDAEGECRVAPTAPTPVAQLLVANHGEPDSRVRAVEQELALQAIRTGAEAERAIGEDLKLRALPVVMAGKARAAILFGWCFTRFSSSLGCQAIGRQLGVDPIELWTRARLEVPVSQGKLEMLAKLMADLVQSHVRHGEALAALERLNGMRDTFLASVSHELRTPLHAISLRLDVLLRKLPEDADALRAALLKIKDHVGVESRLVSDLIEVGRSRTGHLSLDTRPGTLGAILRSALAAIVPQAEAKDVRIEVSGEDADAIALLADPHRLQQVFWNLLSNAVKFTPPGGHVGLATSSDERWCRVSVADTGAGIAPELLPDIFEPFTRQMSQNETGLGLGLAIARQIVEAHGGTIRASSAGADQGTLFEVVLPRA